VKIRAGLPALAAGLLLAGFAAAAGPHPPPGMPGMPDLPQDESAPSQQVPPGSVAIEIRDAQDRPLPRAPVELRILKMTPQGPGDARVDRQATTDAQGRTAFGGVAVDAPDAYEVATRFSGVLYRAAPFTLEPTAGQSVILHVYPTSTDLDQVQVALRSFVFVEPREDAFFFQVLVQALNLGRVTWLPTGIEFELPAGAGSFSPGSAESLYAEAGPSGSVRLGGNVPPGQQETSFTFQVPSAHVDTARFSLGLPPRIAQARVLAVASRTMSLGVVGFPQATRTRSDQGDPVLVTELAATAAGTEPTRLDITIAGLPTGGGGRTVALLLAIGAFGLGLLVALRRRGRPPNDAQAIQDDLRVASNLLLDELVALEAAHDQQQIPDPAWKLERASLLDAAARLELRITPTPAPRRKRSRKPG
jgi:hypothetical protein